MTKQSIIGFYRNDNRITPIYNDSNLYYDAGLQETCQAHIVPLIAIEQTHQAWTLSPDFTQVDGPLKKLLETGSILITAPPGTESEIYALMYPPADDPNMSRGGALLYKKNETYAPVTVPINGVEFIVEIKGCGCPMGGFSGMHPRNQAGTLSDRKVRLTGALVYEGAVSEYHNIELNRSFREEHLGDFQLRALGYIRFKIPPHLDDFGQVLRLSPSTVRIGFQKNTSFDPLTHVSQEQFFRVAGQEVAILLEGEPQIHRNLSWSNFVYISPGKYTLTDYEEADPGYQGHGSLQIKDYIYPYAFHFKENMRYFKDFLAGLCDIDGTAKTSLLHHPPQDIHALNDQLFKDCIAVKALQSRLSNPPDYHYLADNIASLKYSMPEAYFIKPVFQWIEEDYLPLLNKKIALCHVYREIIEHAGVKALGDIIFDRAAPALSAWKTQLDRIEPELRLILSYRHLKSLFEKPEHFGTRFSLDNLYNRYITVPANIEVLDSRLQLLESYRIGIRQYLNDKQVQTLPQGMLHGRIEPATDLMCDIYPFYVFCRVNFENEKVLLEACMDQTNAFSPEHQALIKENLSTLLERIAILETEPHRVHHELTKGENRLLKFIKLPYQFLFPRP